MTDAELDTLRALLKAKSGLQLTPEKRYLVESRLGPICRRHGLSLSELAKALKAGGVDLERAVVEAMTTNETSFFRDRTPFDLFRDVLLPRALETRAATRRLRIWCAASSTGQEPYSLAMILSEAGAKLSGWQVEILATDLSTEVLEKARAGLYSQFEVQRGLPIRLMMKYFAKDGDAWRIAPALRSMVGFRPLNLIRPFGHLGQFDIVFCRNVLIYFDRPTRSEVFRRLSGVLAPDGSLLLGAAETVIGLTETLVPDPARRGLYVHARSGPAAAPLRLVASR